MPRGGFQGPSLANDADAFAIVVGEFVDDLDGDLVAVQREVALDVLENVQVGGRYCATGTPVDTGYTRNSWLVSLGDAPVGLDLGPRPKRGEQLADASAQATADAIATLAGLALGESITIGNGSDAAPYLEDGSSAQAREGMVRVTVLHAQEIVDDAVDRVRKARGATD